MATASFLMASYGNATQADESDWNTNSISDARCLIEESEPDECLRPEQHVTTSSSVTSCHRFRSDWPLVWPLCAALAITVAILATNSDLRVAEAMFDRDAGTWIFASNSLLKFVYRYGPLPGVFAGIAAAFVAIFGRGVLPRGVWSESHDIRRACLFLALLLVIGPGLIINSGLKSMWGRPRPSECQQFGGDRNFTPVGVATHQLKPNSSFPSGHASMAFYWMAPGFIFAHRRRCLSLGFFAGGTAYGLAMGAIRIAQGGHFLSDVIWAGAIVYLVGVVLARLVLHGQGWSDRGAEHE